MTSIIAPIKTQTPAAFSSAGVEVAAGGLRRRDGPSSSVASPWTGRGAARPSSIRLPVDVAAAVRTALARRPHGAAVVVLRDAEVAVEDRGDLWRHYHRVGVRELVQRLRYAVVPPGHALALVDLEKGTSLFTIPIDDLCGPAWPVADGEGGGQ